MNNRQRRRPRHGGGLGGAVGDGGGVSGAAGDGGGRKASQANIIRGRGTEDGLLPTPDRPAYANPVSVAGCRSQVAGRRSHEESTEVKEGGGRRRAAQRRNTPGAGGMVDDGAGATQP
jgi:hypothetical protein